jgi:hypothetical protein
MLTRLTLPDWIQARPFPIIRDLQIREYEHPFLWWPKFLLMLFVCIYWAAREAHRPR